MSDGELETMQRWLLDTLLTPGPLDRAELDRHLLAGPKLDAAACLGIYRRSYIARLERCLAEQFPASCHALGEALFHDFAREYLREAPSDAYTLYALGRRFPAWLEASRPDRDAPADEREDWIDFLVDLAHYERALFVLFDAPGHEGEAWPGPEVDDDALVLQPCLSLGAYRFPVAWYYHEVRAERGPEFPPAETTHVAVVRREFQTKTYPISALHHRFLTAVARHGGVPPALRELAEAEGRSLDDVRRSWIDDVRRPWIAAGFFVARGT